MVMLVVFVGIYILVSAIQAYSISVTVDHIENEVNDLATEIYRMELFMKVFDNDSRENKSV